jgi:hypothetical protein
MRLPGYLIAFVLAMLLAGTTPTGTGAGVHQFDLLHPLFSHVHLINGRIVSHEQMERSSTSAPQVAPRPGTTALGAGQAAAAADGGLGVSPTVPGQAVLVIWDQPTRRVHLETARPHSVEEAPPDPPPL